MASLKNNTTEYSYYSKLLCKPFDSLSELCEAEKAELAARKEKAKAAKAKKAAAEEVEEAYKNLNAARRKYKTDLHNTIVKYTEDMKALQEQFIANKKAINEEIANAEKVYKEKLKDFTDKHPEGFHITLKDGDYETTISSASNVVNNVNDWTLQFFRDIFNI